MNNFHAATQRRSMLTKFSILMSIFTLTACTESPTSPSSEDNGSQAISYESFLGERFRVTIIGTVFAPTDYANEGWDGTVDPATITKFSELAGSPDIAIGSPGMISLVTYVAGLTLTGTQWPEPLGTSQIDTGDGYWRDQYLNGRDNSGGDKWDSLKTESENSLFVDWANKYQPSYIFNLRKSTQIKVHLVDYDPFNANDEAGTCTITYEEIAQSSSIAKIVDVPCLEETRKNVVSLRIKTSLIE